MPPRVDSIALLECTMQMIRETHANWNEDQILEHAFSIMNLQPNTSQAEKIPKSVLSIISQIVKLNENNWAIWEPIVRGLAPETQVGLSRYLVTIKLCDSYCLSISLDELVIWQLSSCTMAAGGVCCIYYHRFRLTSVDTPFRGSLA